MNYDQNEISRERVCLCVVADTYRRVTYYMDVQRLWPLRAGKGYICYSLRAMLFSDRVDIIERRFRLLRNFPSRAPPPPTPCAPTK